VRRALTRGLLSLVFLAALSSSARADDDPWGRRFVLGGQLDVTPYVTSGLFVTAELAPVRWVSLEVGAGGTLELAPAWLAMLHGQVPVGAFAFGGEAGIVVGRLDIGDGCRLKAFGTDCLGAGRQFFYDSASLSRRIDSAVFGRGGATVAWRSEGGWWQVRAHAGVTGLVNGSSAHCVLGGMSVPAGVDCSLGSSTVPVAAYVGVGVGVPFDF
jgi:hypothetical protein